MTDSIVAIWAFNWSVETPSVAAADAAFCDASANSPTSAAEIFATLAD